MNPYVIPAMETPDEPLCPFRHDHEKYYVNVDSTEAEFKRFQQRIVPHGGFRSRGRLIVVTGKDGCGKTSLINRCAAWLHGQLAGMAQIFPLADSTVASVSLRVRMEQVLDALIDELSGETSNVVDTQVERLGQRLKELRDRAPDADEEHHAGIERVYSYLNRALPPGQVAIILLPRSELGREIEKYSTLARFPQLIFFAESRYSDDVRRSVQTARRGDNTAPIMLEVGPLNLDDGWRYAEARQGPDPVGKDTPFVTEQTMGRVVANASKDMSIRRLHGLLYGVYKEFSDHPERIGSLVSREVSYEHFTDFHYRSFGTSGAGS